MLESKVLTTLEGRLVELLPPCLVDLHFLKALFLLSRCEPKLVCMTDEVVDIDWVHGVQQVEEELAIRTSAFWVLVWKVLHDILVLLEVWEEVLDTELIVSRDVDKTNVLELENLLLVGEDFSNEVLVHH